MRKKKADYVQFPKSEIRNRWSKPTCTTNLNNESKTIQHFAKDLDISQIIKQAMKTGDMTLLNRVQGFYGDFTQYADQVSNMETLQRAREHFEALPNSVKNVFPTADALLKFTDSAMERAQQGDMHQYNYGVGLGIFMEPQYNPGQQSNQNQNQQSPTPVSQGAGEQSAKK